MVQQRETRIGEGLAVGPGEGSGDGSVLRKADGTKLGKTDGPGDGSGLGKVEG